MCRDLPTSESCKGLCLIYPSPLTGGSLLTQCCGCQGTARAGCCTREDDPGTKGDSTAGRGSILTHESHGLAGTKPGAQSSSPGRSQGQPTVRYSPDESLARQAGVSEEGSGSARSTAGVPGIPTALLRQGPRLVACA